MSEFKRILLVDDDHREAELALEALATPHNLAGEVAVAGDGPEALDYLRRQGRFTQRPPGNPAVVLLDLKLPKLDGLEVLREIRADEKLKLIPVVMLTSSEEEKDLLQSYRMGANGYIVKPLDFREFMSAVACLGYFWTAINKPPPRIP